MANVNVDRDGWCPELDLTPGSITTVTFTHEDLDSVELVVINNAGRVRWTCDGSEPGEDAGWYVPVDGVDSQQPPTSGATVVKVWSSGTATACVQRG